MRKILAALILGVGIYGAAYAAATLYVSQNSDIDSAAAEAIDASAPTRCMQVTVRANKGNSADIYIGNSDVSTANGYVLTTTHPTITLDAFDRNGINASAISAVASVSDQAVTLFCVY